MDIIKKFEPVFGVWYVDQLIGAGSFGRVYKIKREELGTQYYSALKFFSIPQSDEETEQLHFDGMDDESIATYYEELVKDINEENLIMSKLKGHTNIVNYEDSRVIKRDSGLGYDIFIRMELLTSLPQYVRNRSFTRKDVIRLGIDMCRALEICVNSNVIHRDIKPDNIFVNENGDFKLGDFGIARRLDKTSSFMSKKGTYNYMAPEVYKGENYDMSVDIYSLGMVMYRFMNGSRLPFLPLAPAPVTPMDKERSITMRMQGEQIPLPCYAQDELGAIIVKACAFYAQDRFATVGQMRMALENLMATENKTEVTVGNVQNEVFDSYNTNSNSENSSFTPVNLYGNEYNRDSKPSNSYNGYNRISKTEGNPMLMHDMEHMAGNDTAFMEQPNKDFEKGLDGDVTSGTQDLFGENAQFFSVSEQMQKESWNEQQLQQEKQKIARNQTASDTREYSGGIETEKRSSTVVVVAVVASIVVILGLGALLAFGVLFPVTDTEKEAIGERLGTPDTKVASNMKPGSDGEIDPYTEPNETANESAKSGKDTPKPSSTAESSTNPKNTKKAKETATPKATPTPAPPSPGQWSAWYDTKPTGKNIEVQSKRFYRYRDWLTRTSTSGKDGSLLNQGYAVTSYKVGDWGKWSGYTANAVKESNNCEVQTQNWYSTRTKTTTESTSSSKAGWTFDYKETEPTGEWGGWQASPIEASDTCEVQTREKEVKQYRIAHYCCEEGSYPSATYSENCQYCEIGWVREDELDSRGLEYIGNQYGKPAYRKSSGCGKNDCDVYYAVEEKTNKITEYRSRTIKTVYHFYKWGEWSDYEYASPAPKENNSREVRTQKMYRYRTRAITYYYGKYSGWSAWQESQISATNTRSVESMVRYRYRTKG